MSRQKTNSLAILRYCSACRPFPVFNEQGDEILPCKKQHCTTIDGKPIFPRSTICPVCKKTFRSGCLPMIYCSESCFQAANSAAEWEAASLPAPRSAEEAAREAKKARRKAATRKWLQTERGKQAKSGQNKRNYRNRKAKRTQEAATAVCPKASETLPTETEFGGLARNYPSVHQKDG